MNKKELIREVGAKSGVSQEKVKLVLDSLRDVVIETTSKGEKISIKGFLKFFPLKRVARIGRNPQTGESISIKEKTIIKAKMLKSVETI